MYYTENQQMRLVPCGDYPLEAANPDPVATLNINYSKSAVHMKHYDSYCVGII